MALQLWFPDDVRRILEALASAGIGNGTGYHAALRDVGLAFGVELVQPRTRREVEYRIVPEDEAVDAQHITWTCRP